MLELKIDDKREYKLKYGYNSFCDTDLLDRVADLFVGEDNGEEATAKTVLGSVKDLFVCVRDLLHVGLQKYHADDFPTISEAGDLIDDYVEADDERTVRDLFALITEELIAQGFLKDILDTIQTDEEVENVTAIPQDHKKSTKKK